MTSQIPSEDTLLAVLQSYPFGLTTSQLRSSCRRRKLFDTIIPLLDALDKLQKDGQIKFEHFRWKAVRPCAGDDFWKDDSWKNDFQEDDSREDDSREGAIHRPQRPADQANSPWALFRRLLPYYRECLLAEDNAADPLARLSDCNRTFIFLGDHLALPEADAPWSHHIFKSPRIGEFVSSIPASGSDKTLILGYPLYAYKYNNDGENDILLRPVFYFAVEYSSDSTFLRLRINQNTPEINKQWLEYAFKKDQERKVNFVSACGFLNRDDANGVSEYASGLDLLVQQLTIFFGKDLRERLDYRDIARDSLEESCACGLYNRCVLMLANRTRYCKTLCNELQEIEQMPDEVLDGTSLAPVFRKGGSSPEAEEALVHEALVPEIFPLNAEQRYATASLLRSRISVITGPPGTGKSQVISTAACALRLDDQSMLFASRNHKAIDAVVSRSEFIRRCNSKDDPNLKYTFQDAVSDLLAVPHSESADADWQRAEAGLSELLRQRGEAAAQAAEYGRLKEELEATAVLVLSLKQQLSMSWGTDFDEESDRFLAGFPERAFRQILNGWQRLAGRQQNLSLCDRVRCVLLVPAILQVRSFLQQWPDCPPMPLSCGTGFLDYVFRYGPQLRDLNELWQQASHGRALEEQIRQLLSFEQLTSRMAELTDQLKKLTSTATDSDVARRAGLKNDVDRREFSSVRSALKAGPVNAAWKRDTDGLVHKYVPVILQGIPCWAVTSLSAGSHIPLQAGMFDLVVVDEASQSDIPSAIPLLFRARRAAVVGDPQQLSHIVTLKEFRHRMMIEQVGLTAGDARFLYSNSLYSLVAGSQAARPVFLAATYRSAPGIAGYSNALWYGGRLRVGTDTDKLRLPPGRKEGGIYWTDIQGEIVSDIHGCYCQDEIGETVRLLRVLLVDNSYKGTVGIVTPFRKQANRIQDALEKADTNFYQALQGALCHVDTVHGFQGGERDVIFFSLCAGPGMPRGSLNFLTNSGKLFNVAASRARAVLHVVGNRTWARQCGIRHVQQLAAPGQHCQPEYEAKGPWAPCESPWELRLYKALRESGLDPRPQFWVGGRRLDLALVDADRKKYVDIEVDGESYHRREDGKRKTDDAWRDMELAAKGWTVRRFWVYELRDNMSLCLEKIREAWGDNGSEQ